VTRQLRVSAGGISLVSARASSEHGRVLTPTYCACAAVTAQPKRKRTCRHQDGLFWMLRCGRYGVVGLDLHQLGRISLRDFIAGRADASQERATERPDNCEPTVIPGNSSAPMTTIEDLIAEYETPEQTAYAARWTAEFNAKPCKYDSVRECYVHGYLPRRPCGHVCCGVPCQKCNRPLTGRQRTRMRWRRQGRR